MKALIKKDLLLVKGNFKTIFAVFLVFIVMSFQKEMNISFLLSLISVMIFMTTFSYDEYNKWDAYAITLPGGRRNLVKGKYMATVLILVVTTILSTLVSMISSSVNHSMNLDTILSTLLGSVAGVILLLSILYPLIFKYGIEKGRIGLFVGLFGLTAIGGLFYTKVKIDISDPLLVSILDFLNQYYYLILPIVFGLIFFGSYQISKKIYKKREF